MTDPVTHHPIVDRLEDAHLVAGLRVLVDEYLSTDRDEVDQICAFQNLVPRLRAKTEGG